MLLRYLGAEERVEKLVMGVGAGRPHVTSRGNTSLANCRLAAPLPSGLCAEWLSHSGTQAVWNPFQSLRASEYGTHVCCCARDCRGRASLLWPH